MLDHPKTLTVLVGGGLCNRLKPIFSAMATAANVGRKLRIMWSTDLDVQPVEPDQHEHYVWPGTWSDLFATKLTFVPWSEAVEIMGQSTEWQDLSNYDNPVVNPDDDRQHIVRSSWRFIRTTADPALDCLLDPHPSSTPFGDRLIKQFGSCRPAAPLQQKIDDFAAANEIGPDSWSVHIRSQHSWCKRFGWENYRDLIDRELQRERPNRIFLSSDNRDYEERLLAIYPQMVAFPKASHECVPSLASGDAVVDLFLLARAGTIMGTTASTFVHTAWYLAGCRSRFVPLY